jgi:hypothetical protein
VNITEAKIIHASNTVGRAPHLPLFPFGLFSYYDYVYRVGIVLANLALDLNGALVKSPAYNNLDPSEKSAISYFLGLIFAKVNSAEFLDTPWLMHLDVYQDLYPAETWKGNKRPDLFGLNRRRDWVVIESKGRTGGFDAEAFKTAKSQTRNIKKIDGAYPGLRIATELFFRSEQVSIRLEDPPDFDENAPDLEIPMERFLMDYYRPLLELVSRPGDDSKSRPDMLSRTIEELDITVSMPLGLIQILRERSGERLVEEIIRYLENLQTETKSEPNLELGGDGIRVELGRTSISGDLNMIS